ncbi:toxin glutamine deamidase domain-containing protein [Streptomyces bullii]|uniref:Toxin glutamine deamidase domain-containing protein n=1 Tax=Streptomyces bullii TaxID=349910 RepID=A0ABW0V2Y9_9ACTN
MMLPDELEWVLEMLGYKWPTANEDKLRDCAELWRKFGDDVTELHTRANTVAGTVVAHNAGDSIDAFRKTYKKFDGGDGSDGYLANAAQAAYLIANVLEACAYLVEFAKWAVIAQLIALAIQIAAAAAAAPVTFGLSSVAGMGATQAARVIVRRILDELKQAMIEALIETLKEPAISAVEAMITDLVRQTVNVGFGAQEGYDLGTTMKAGGEAGLEALRQSPQTFAEGVRDSLGQKAGSRARDAIDSRIDGYDGVSGTPGSDGGSNSGSGVDGKDSGSGSGKDSGAGSSDSSSSNSSSFDASSSGSDSSTPTRASNGSGPGVNIGGGISADTGGNDIGAPDVGAGPNSGSGSDSGSPSSSDTSYPRPTPALSGPSLSDFDDPSPGGASPGGAGSNGSSGTPSTSGPSHSGGGSPVSGLSSPTPQSAPTSAASGGTSSSPGGGSIGTQIDGLAATAPTAANAAPTAPTADPSSGGSGGRTDGGSAMPTSPVAPATAGVAGGSPQGAGASGGTPAGTGPTSPSANSGAARNPSGSTPGTPSPAGTGPASTPSPTSPTTSRSTPTPDGRIPGAADGRTPGTPSTPSTPDGRIPTQRTPGKTPGDGAPPRATPGSTPGDSTAPRNTPGTTPGDRTPPRNSPGTTPGDGTPSRNAPGTTPGDGSTPRNTPGTTPGQSSNTNPATSQNPSTTAPNQNPGQSSPTRTASPSTSAPTSTPSTSTGTGPERTSTPSSGTPNSSTQPGPTTQGTAGTPNQPSAGSTPARPPHQPAGGTPNTPNQPGAQPNTQQQSANNPNQQQQPQVTPVPIHHVTQVPSNRPHQPTTQTPDSTPTNPNQQSSSDHPKPKHPPTPASETRNTTPPGGVIEPTRGEQDALENSVPRDENGDPTRPPNPADGPWVERINGEGRDAPGRNNNCVDVALSVVDTYAGNPTAAASRTPDLDADGNPSDRGEKGGRDRIENTLGARFNDLGNGRDAFNRLENTLRDSGHGSQAVIITQDANGRAHAWNAVNHNGEITYIDAQTGQQSSKPLHSGDHGVFAIPLDGNRQPVSPDGGSTSDRSRSHSTNQAGRQFPAAPAGTDRRPPEDPAGADPKKNNQNLPDDPTREERNKSLPKPEDRTEEHQNLPPDSPQQTVRNYPSDDRDEHKDYDPDAARGLKVYRIGLDPVHDSLRNWADEGRLTPLLQAAADRMDAYHQARENGDTDLPPTAFTRQELEDALGDDFRQMNDGQRYAVVASLARLSLGFHESQGVGHNPEHDRDGRPYAGSTRSDGTPDVASDNPRARSSEARDEANAKFPKMYRSDPETNKNISELHHRVTGEHKASPTNAQVNALIDAMAPHKPDFSGKNYAVIEVVDNNGNSTFVVDSSVPADPTGVTPRHSEKHLLDWFDRTNSGPEGKKYRIAGLYTEREPCGSGQGHADCSTRLRTHPEFKDGRVPVYYSTTYRTDPEGVAEREAARAKLKSQQEKSGLTDQQIANRVKKIRTENEDEMQAEMDRHLSAIGSVWAKAMLHVNPPQ